MRDTEKYQHLINPGKQRHSWLEDRCEQQEVSKRGRVKPEKARTHHYATMFVLYITLSWQMGSGATTCNCKVKTPGAPLESQGKTSRRNSHSVNWAAAAVCRGGNPVWAPQSSCWKWRGCGERPRPGGNRQKPPLETHRYLSPALPAW